MGRGFRGLPAVWEKGHPTAFRRRPEATRVSAGPSLCLFHTTTPHAPLQPHWPLGPRKTGIIRSHHRALAPALPPGLHASPHISTGLSSNVTAGERPSWPHVTLLYCPHSSLPTPLMCSCPPHALSRYLTPSALGWTPSVFTGCRLVGNQYTCVKSPKGPPSASASCTSVWSVSIGPDVLFPLVNYCGIIIVRSVSTDCINEETHKRFHALAHRTLDLAMGHPAAC